MNYMIKDIAIIIPCYNRPVSLCGLLNSLLRAKYDRRVELVFSIDYSGSDDVNQVADNFEWPFGKKTIIRHTCKIGLRRNIIFCGDLTQSHDAVIVLEDDLVVSPWFFIYASRACDFYWNEDRVGGISLYSYRFTENRHEFFPLTMGYDTYFIQWTSSWGQLWTKKQWNGFKEWYGEHNKSLDKYHIPPFVKKWEESWKKYNIAYIADTDRFYAYPQQSYTTMVPTEGTHVTTEGSRRFQVPLCSGLQRNFVFQRFEDAVKYDSYFELCSQTIEVDGNKLPVSFNIYCQKQQNDIDRDFYISSKRQLQQPIKTWSRNELPFEKNVLENLNGIGLYLYRKSDYQGDGLTADEKKIMNVALSGKEQIQISIKRFLRNKGILPKTKQEG